MLLLLVVSLYTSRILLKVLGINDYGIYNLIAGFVTFLIFISNALVSAMQRYFNVALGRNDIKYYREVFSMSLNILAVFSCIIIFLGETIGLWFVMNHLNIPNERHNAAILVYHISLLTFVANTLRTPFHASIIAHEKMSFYAYISLFEAFARLGVIFLLSRISGDHLVIYAILYLIVIIIINAIYVLYCKRQFEECRYLYRKNTALLKDLVSFSGWTLMGQASVVIKNQGEAILINRFFSVVSNAAMGIASQVTSALEMFVINFQTAFRPQLIQSYASKDFDAHKNLLFRSSKFSYFLLFIMFVPVVFNIDLILKLWLVQVPENTSYFIVFTLISYLFNAFSNPFTTSIFASGKIKNYQISLSIIFLCSLLVDFVLLYLGAKSYVISIVAIATQTALMIVRLSVVHKYIKFSYAKFIINVVVPIILMTCLAIALSYILHLWANNLIETIVSIFLEVISICLLVLFIGMNKSERHYILSMLKLK